jgi:hypothetical protein
MVDPYGSLFGKSTTGPWDKPWDSAHGSGGVIFPGHAEETHKFSGMPGFSDLQTQAKLLADELAGIDAAVTQGMGYVEATHTPEDSGVRRLVELFAEQLAGRDAALAQAVERLNQYVAALAERDRQIRSLIDEVSSLRARGDRFQAKGRQLLAEVAGLRAHAEAIRNFAGGRNAMLKAIHPDTGPPEDRAARTEIFKLIQLIFEDR